jgi:ketosteroid isomerase-like protein
VASWLDRSRWKHQDRRLEYASQSEPDCGSFSRFFSRVSERAVLGKRVLDPTPSPPVGFEGGKRRQPDGRVSEAIAVPSEDFNQALKRVEEAIKALTSGDPEPYVACWSHGADVTLFGAGGSNPRGWPAIAEPIRAIARHFVGHSGHVCENEVVHIGSDLAVTVGFQRGEPGGDDETPRQETILRVTHVYRHEDGVWKIIHRHADSQRAAEAERPKTSP